MKKSAFAAAAGLAVALAAPGVSRAGDMDLIKVPKAWTYNGNTFNNLEGFVINIPDTTKITKYTTTHPADVPLYCTQIHYTYWDNGRSLRQRCFDGVDKDYTCPTIYDLNPSYQPKTRVSQLTAFRPIQEFLRTADFLQNGPSGTSRVIAINANFFNTKAFQNRSTDDTKWKPIFQEACGLNLGTFRSMVPNGDGTFDMVKSGVFSNVETSGDGQFGTGTADKPFGTLAFKGPRSGYHAKSLNKSLESTIGADWPAISGVWIRNSGTKYNATSSHVPSFVSVNWDKKVGRTAIGVSSKSRAMRIVVIQPGAAEAKTGGVDVPTLQKMFDSTFDYVLLLDGGGSSSLAANFEASTLPGQATTGGRADGDCLGSKVKTCTLRGNYVDSWAVQHWRGEDGTDDFFMRPGPNDQTKLVDRWIPNAFILIDD